MLKSESKIKCIYYNILSNYKISNHNSFVVNRPWNLTMHPPPLSALSWVGYCFSHMCKVFTTKLSLKSLCFGNLRVEDSTTLFLQNIYFNQGTPVETY